MNKGIPVIFVDELQDNPEIPKPHTPLILKEEKPPLPPPEYPRSSNGRIYPTALTNKTNFSDLAPLVSIRGKVR